jgi:methylthioribose-1-phosphate isomerase
MRVATFNVENLFSRPAVLNMKDNDRAAAILAKISELTGLLDLKSYASKKRRIESLHADVKNFISINIRSSKVGRFLFTAESKLVARGRGDWDGFVDLQRELAPRHRPGPVLPPSVRDRHLVRGRHARAKRAAAILPNPARVLTHCNVSGELVAVARHCKELGKELSVIATETRPYLQGTRLTAWELAQAGVPVSSIPDCAIAQVMANGEVNGVIVGADRTARNGDIINKVGTYPIARLAKEYGVPFHALVQDPRSLERGADVRIEERPAHELLIFDGQPLVAGALSGLSARYPSFDMTPAALITHLVGFDDLYTPESFRRKYQGKVEADDNQSDAGGKYILLYGVPPKSQYSFLISALKADRAESVLVPEMRPQLWGARVVARELLERRVLEVAHAAPEVELPPDDARADGPDRAGAGVTVPIELPRNARPEL